MTEDHGRTLRFEEPARVPTDAVFLGWGPVIPFPIAAIWLWLGGPGGLVSVMHIWAAALLVFLSGVRRGLSFRTPCGWTWAQFAIFAILFWAGIAAILLLAEPALVLLAVVFASLAVIDPVSADRGEAPLWFRRLRPGQMLSAGVGLAGIWWHG